MNNKFALTVLLMFSFVLVGISQSIAGKWKGTAETDQGAFNLVFNFEPMDNVLTGNVMSDMGDMAISNGKIDGKKFTFDIATDQFTISHQCTLTEEDKIEVKNDFAEMTLTRVKE